MKQAKLVDVLRRAINQMGKDLADGDLLKGILHFRERKRVVSQSNSQT